MSQSHLLIRCPACQALNRLPLGRAGQQGRCGKCREPLPPNTFYAAGAVELSDGRFDTVTRLSPHPVLVDFWAQWCAPCRQLAPALEQLATEYAERLLVVKLNTEEHRATTKRFGVSSIPTLVLLRSGIEVDRMMGALPLEALRTRVEQFLN